MAGNGAAVPGQPGHYDVAIVGAGFAGAMVAVHLAREAPSLRVSLHDGDGGGGRGVAYGTTSMRHLLNVPAGKMSAFPDAPDHFYEWLKEQWLPDVGRGAFAPRQLYGAYVRGILEAATGIKIRRDRIVDLMPVSGGYSLTVSNGEQFTATKVVLALGNYPPAHVPGLSNAAHENFRYIHSPWSADALSRIGRHDDVLVVGSGLTAIDVLLSLEEAGVQGRIHVLSRRGLLPLCHAAHVATPDLFSGRALPEKLSSMVRLVRDEAEGAVAHGGDWRAVVDALRAHTQGYWGSLACEERRRFMRHVRPFWEAHRHRVAPEVVSVIDRLSATNQLALHKARIRAIDLVDDHFVAHVIERTSAKAMTIRAQFVINCTGPESNYRRLDDPLVRNLIGRRMIKLDPLALGIETASDGAIMDGNDAVSPDIFAIGSPRKGTLYETTAVPELRAQAQELAMTLLAGSSHFA